MAMKKYDFDINGFLLMSIVYPMCYFPGELKLEKISFKFIVVFHENV
jgi:hypothetical protein